MLSTSVLACGAMDWPMLHVASSSPRAVSVSVARVQVLQHFQCNERGTKSMAQEDGGASAEGEVRGINSLMDADRELRLIAKMLCDGDFGKVIDWPSDTARSVSRTRDTASRHKRRRWGEQFVVAEAGRGQVRQDLHSGSSSPVNLARAAQNAQRRRTSRAPSSGVRGYICQYCDRRLRNLSELEAHVRTHTGEKPLRCMYCSKAFAHCSNLRAHERTHRGEKPYVCTFKGCGRCYAHPSSLKEHRRSHTGERPYACPAPDCGRTFTGLSNYRRHRRLHEKRVQQVASS